MRLNSSLKSIPRVPGNGPSRGMVLKVKLKRSRLKIEFQLSRISCEYPATEYGFCPLGNYFIPCQNNKILEGQTDPLILRQIVFLRNVFQYRDNFDICHRRDLNHSFHYQVKIREARF